MLLARFRFFGAENKKTRPLEKIPEDEKYLVVPPRFTSVSRQKPYQVLTYLSSVTGTPVAAYSKFRCAAHEMYSVYLSHCLAPSDNSLKALGQTYLFSVIAFFEVVTILAHSFGKIKSFLKNFS